MCAISGIIAKDSKKYTDELEKMLASVKHRGPDENGTHFFSDCALGHNRLSIIDLSTGKQPMLSLDEKKAVVFNGEIYGYKDIKDKLGGYAFKTTSDTEVILALYEKYGENLFNHLPGMFAFALWDGEKKQLLAARDRFGEKPFYYAVGRDGEFIFASEIKAILASGLVEPVLEKESVAFYLKHLYVHPYKSIYKNINTLPPGHQLIYKNGKPSIKRYWEQPKSRDSISLDDAIGQFKGLFNRAVERQLVADVPVGAFLSGGLDSSTIVAIASQYTDKLKTFSFGFEDSINELPYAKEIAQKYNTEHIELFDNEDIGSLLLKMDEIYDEPFADSSNIPTYLMSKAARKYLKVALVGDGGDELLGGYGWYKPFLYAKNFGNKNKTKADFLYFVSRVVARLPVDKKNMLSHFLKGQAYSLKYDSVVQAHSSQVNVFEDGDLSLLGLNTGKEDFKDFSWEPKNTVEDAMRMDLEVNMPGDMLVKIDRASMANGLELRAPFLDMDFASFCISLSFSLKITKDDDKVILRKAFSGLWTDSIRKRKKQGFGAPVDKWLKKESVKRIKSEYLNDPSKKIFNIISFKNSRKFVKKDKYQAWALLVLAIWMENRKFKI